MISLLLVAEQRKNEATIHTIHNAAQRFLTREEAEEEVGPLQEVTKVKKALVACPSDTDEES